MIDQVATHLQWDCITQTLIGIFVKDIGRVNFCLNGFFNIYPIIWVGVLYHTIYNRRTPCERINSQAQALGIERPKVRNGRSVANLNTFTYVIINMNALQKSNSIISRLLQKHLFRPFNGL